MIDYKFYKFIFSMPAALLQDDDRVLAGFVSHRIY